MTLVRHYEHQGQAFSVTVNKAAGHFTAVIHIPGRGLTRMHGELEADSLEGAFRLAGYRAVRLIDGATAPVAHAALI